MPGLAIAVVDDRGILWAEGFGKTDWDRRIPVTSDTLFSIQSMSKSFTATAAMLAAHDGLVEHEAPLTRYLPDFHVNCIFEERPEQEITLRPLLSHTAGLAHEAPVGGWYGQRAETATTVAPAFGPIRGSAAVPSDSTLSSLIAGRVLPLDEAARRRRQACAGDYVITR